jgi:hypothetical protein
MYIRRHNTYSPALAQVASDQHIGCNMYAFAGLGRKAERSRQGCFASMHRNLGPAVRSTSSRSLSDQSVSARADRVRLHDSALRLKISSSASGVLYRYGFAGESVEAGEKDGEGDGAVSSLRAFPRAWGRWRFTAKAQTLPKRAVSVFRRSPSR